MLRDCEKVALACRMRSEGRMQREIAAALGISPTTASARTRGVLPHGRRSADLRKLRVLPILARMYRAGNSITQIAAATGIPAPTLFDWRREMGLPKNRRSAYVTTEMRQRTREQFSRDSGGVLRDEAARLYSEEKTSVEIATDESHERHSVRVAAVNGNRAFLFG